MVASAPVHVHVHVHAQHRPACACMALAHTGSWSWRHEVNVRVLERLEVAREPQHEQAHTQRMPRAVPVGLIKYVTDDNCIN